MMSQCATTRALLLLLLLLLLLSTSALAALDVRFDKATGAYDVLVDGREWFSGGIPAVSSDGVWHTTSLKLASIAQSSGKNRIGSYEETTLTFKTSAGLAVEFSAQTYPERPDVLTFHQDFVDGIQHAARSKNASAPDPVDLTAASWPTLRPGADYDLGFFSYHGNMGWDVSAGKFTAEGLKSFVGGGSGGVPLITFTSSALPQQPKHAVVASPLNHLPQQPKHAVVASPLNHFMSSSIVTDPAMPAGSVSFGPLGSAAVIPKDTKYAYVLVHGAGVNAAMDTWGELLRTMHGKTATLRETDSTNRLLGYWTDAGECYWYHTMEGKNYAETLEAVFGASKANNYPFAYLQLDSWWYFKGPHDGCLNWTAQEAVFPQGIRPVVDATWPRGVVAHNRWWSNLTTYAKANGGRYEFYVSPSTPFALPLEQRFWDDLITSSVKSWNLHTYEQDWLDTQFDNLPLLQDNITIGDQWLSMMNDACAKSNVTMQLCMPYPRHYLASVTMGQVTSIRVSNDHHPGNNQWQIGLTSVFADVLGVAPFKDAFHTEVSEEGCSDDHKEVDPLREALVTVFSAGPGGVGDKVGRSNMTIIAPMVMADGTLLKPSRPARAVDAEFEQLALPGAAGGPKGQVWGTWTQVSGQAFGYMLVSNLTAEWSVTLADANVGVSASTSAPLQWLVDVGGRGVQTISSPSTPFKLPATGPLSQYVVRVVPAINGVFLWGEENKYVSVSAPRFSEVKSSGSKHDDDSVDVTMRGVEGETVVLSFQEGTSGSKQTCKVNIPSAGIVTVSVPSCTTSSAAAV